MSLPGLNWSVQCTKQRIKCLAQDHNTVPPERLEPATPQSRVKHPTTEQLCWTHCDMRKPTLWLCVTRSLRSAKASAQSDQILHCQHEESLDPLLPTECTAKTQINAQTDLRLCFALILLVCHVMDQNIFYIQLMYHLISTHTLISTH